MNFKFLIFLNSKFLILNSKYQPFLEPFDGEKTDYQRKGDNIKRVEHWPALFMLSLCLGYTYEKSGSLFRPIFVNAMSVIAVLNQ